MSLCFSLTVASTTWFYTLSLHDALPILVLQGNGLTLAQLGTVTHSGGVVSLQTTLNDTGATLNVGTGTDRKSTRLNSSHRTTTYAVFCLKKKIAFAGGTLSGVSYDGTMD